ncbi:MAG: beta-propeller fold lactonase family protein [Alphaproteobacteria bacterium]|nr:beta-propeller fold lactonase family protein [Alphaproteobacteria bacterium]
MFANSGKVKTFAFIITLAGFALPALAEQFLFLAAAKDPGLVSFRIDPQSGKLTEHDRLLLDGVGGPMALAADGVMLYVESHIKAEGEKQAKPHIVSIKIKSGKFEKLHVAPVRLRSPSIHVDATGKTLLGAHYGEGKVSAWKIDANRHCTGELIDDHTTAEQAHFITTDPSNRFVYVPHTKSNTVYQFAFDAAKGKLTPLDPPFAKGPDEDHQYHAPRHYAHHPTLPMAFTANERGGGISSWKFDDKTGRLTLSQTLSALPPDWKGESYAADIHITPNGRFAYVSNRDGRKLNAGEPHGDTLAAFEIDLKTGKLKSAGHYATERFPRSFCIDKAGHFLFAAGELNDRLAVYRIDQNTGALERIGTYDTGKTPIWVTCWNE